MTTQTQLGVAGIDDKMDMALSPYQPVDDLDLDFDHMEDTHHLQSHHEHGDQSYTIDDAMAEENLEVLDDDEMLDDHATNHDQGGDLDVEVPDQPDHQQEEQIIDDEDILYDDDDVDQTITEENTNAAETSAHPTEVQNEEKDLANAQTAPNDDTTTYEYDTLETFNTDLQGNDESTEQGLADTTAQDPVNQDANGTTLEGAKSSDVAAVELEQAHGKTFQSALVPESDGGDATVSTEAGVDVRTQQSLESAAIEDSAVDAALHSIRLFWNNEEWRLFSSDQDASDCFFHSTDLAYQPMDVLLEACRGVIPSNELGDHDELTFIIEEMGLTICEDSKYAPSMTLARIIQVYLTLHRNGSQDAVDLIACSLHSRTCLQTYYAKLLQDAMSGRSLIEVVGDIHDSPDELEDDAEEDGAGVQNEQYADHNRVDAADGVQEHVKIATAPDESAVADIGAGTEARDFAQAAESVTAKLEADTGVDAAANYDETGENDLLDVFDDEPEVQAEEKHSYQAPENEPYLEHTSFALDSDSVTDGQQHIDTAPTQNNATNHSFGGEESHNAVEQPFAGDDSPNYEDPGAPAPVNDEFYNSDDELLRLRQEEYRRASIETPNPAPDISFNISNGDHEPPLDGEEAIEAVPEEEELDLLSMPPETPQKGSDKKRKALEEEDDFLLTGLDTPEPKRRRPS